MAARLIVAGPAADEVEPLLLDPDGVELAGPVDEGEKWRLLGEADLLCAPSLGGESFGMVLTEAASRTPVVASDIAGYRDVVRHDLDGMLVPVGDAVALGESLRALAFDPARRSAMAASARERAERFAAAGRRGGNRGLRAGAGRAGAARRRAADRAPRGSCAQRARATGAPTAAALARAEHPGWGPTQRGAGGAQRLVGAGIAAGAGLALLALQRIGIESIGRAMLAATPVWVLVAFALMCASMLLRSEAWHAILRAALPGTRVRRRDTARGTMIGVLMSATLPARLGEPSRALIVARRVRTPGPMAAGVRRR